MGINSDMSVGFDAAMQAKYLADGWLYSALWPVTRLLRDKVHPPPRQDEIALTFDDGPNAEFTPRFLDLLGRYEIKAVFFLVGKFAKEHPYVVRRILAEGHTIGNHSWAHPNLAKISAAKVRDELQSTNRILEQITGLPVAFFRPPYGSSNTEVLKIARDMGMLPVFWNAIAPDWELRSAARIVDELGWQIERNQRRRRATCLVLHDGRADNAGADCTPSLEAAATLIERMRPKHHFVSIETWRP